MGNLREEFEEEDDGRIEQLAAYWPPAWVVFSIIIGPCNCTII